MTATKTLTDEERLDWLRLWRSENVGPITFLELLRATGSAGAALGALPDLARRGGLRRKIKIFPKDQARKEMDALIAAGGRFIAIGEPAYPTPLAAIADPPPGISVFGHPDLLARDIVAIVGARNASASGGRFARELAAELGAAKYVVSSGLARGIDSQAHLGSVESGTIAVVAGGVDNIYPAENAELYARIVEAGAVVSEQPFGLKPQGRHFPRRNRIISGLALGVVVVEASLRSGTLITARLAGEQGREVFSVPGSPLDPRHRGTNRLIRDGAALTEGADDVIEVLSTIRRDRLGEPQRTPASGETPRISAENKVSDEARESVLSALGPTPVGVDELVRQCHLTPADVMVVVLELELAGRLQRHGGGAVSLL
jgi:DNA processing protein